VCRAEKTQNKKKRAAPGFGGGGGRKRGGCTPKAKVGADVSDKAGDEGGNRRVGTGKKGKGIIWGEVLKVKGNSKKKPNWWEYMIGSQIGAV